MEIQKEDIEKRLNVLFIPAWYPSEINLIEGIFVEEHAKAANLYNEIVVLYAYGDSAPSFKFFKITENVEDRIKTIRVRYGGILSYLWRKFRAKELKENTSRDSQHMFGTVVINFLSILKLITSDLLYFLSIFIGFKKLIREGYKPDIIHAHVYSAGFPAIILGRLYGTPVVVSEHSSIFISHGLTFFERKKAQFIFNKANQVLPVSNVLKEAIKAYRVINKFTVIPNVVNIEIFHPVPFHNRSEYGDNKRILTVTTLNQQKGVSYLIDALKWIKGKRTDFFLDIVGEGPDRDELEVQVKRASLEKMVKFHGLKSKEDVSEFMQKCDFFVQPSLYETFGVVYIEAMACGKPVIASKIAGALEIVNENAGILIPPGNTQALAQAIEFMMDNYQNYSPQKIAQYAREKFSYQTVGSRLDAIYREIITNSKHLTGQSKPATQGGSWRL